MATSTSPGHGLPANEKGPGPRLITTLPAGAATKLVVVALVVVALNESG
jgi:hypothetical protein